MKLFSIGAGSATSEPKPEPKVIEGERIELATRLQGFQMDSSAVWWKGSVDQQQYRICVRSGYLFESGFNFTVYLDEGGGLEKPYRQLAEGEGYRTQEDALEAAKKKALLHANWLRVEAQGHF